MTALAVEATNLSKSYDKQPALDRVDLRVLEGSVYVLGIDPRNLLIDADPTDNLKDVAKP